MYQVNLFKGQNSTPPCFHESLVLPLGVFLFLFCYFDVITLCFFDLTS